ncbi:YncE family protein [Bacillus rubiinfantis]|uniref:YncE family protein n=1 Tax=Bacillus rubiinfantis TaxID=1499680 RepID=UPI0005A95E24|nr:YncE family protein [Bacillus rubiinfantis]
MRKSGVILLIICLTLISGCQEKNISVPPSMNNYLIVSNLKKAELSFTNIKTGTYLTEEIPFRITSMAKVNHNTIILAGENEDFLYRLNLKSGALTKFFQASKGVNELLYDSKNKLLIFSNSQADQIGMYDVQNEKLIAEIPVGRYPLSLALNRKNLKLYVINVKSATLSVIDMKNKKQIAQFPIVKRPKGLYFDGKDVWVGGHGPYGTLNETIFVYNPETGKEVDRIKVGVMPVDFYGDSSSSYVYAICHGSSSVYRIDVHVRSVSEPLQVGANPYDIIGDSRKIFVTSVDGDSLAIIDRTTFTVSKEMKLKNGPHMMVLGEKDE